VGSTKQWRQYRERLNGAIAEAVGDGTLRDKKELRRVFVVLDRESIPAIDPQGRAWLVWHAGTREERRVGVDWSNVQAAGSDTWLARRMLLARMDAELHGPAKARSALAQFAREWELLEELEHRHTAKASDQNGSIAGSSFR
jgi:hypothetical protein